MEDLKTLLLFQYSMYLHFLVQNWRIKGIFFSKPITNEPTLFTFRIPSPESWIHQEDKCGFISEKSWNFEDWFSLWLILWETDTGSHSSHFSVLTGYNKKIVLFISSFLQPQNILHIFSTEIVLWLRHNNKHFYRNILVMYLRYRVFHNNRPKITAYCSYNKSLRDSQRLLGAHQMGSIW